MNDARAAEEALRRSFDLVVEGRPEEALEVLHRALEDDQPVVDKARLLFAQGRLLVEVNRIGRGQSILRSVASVLSAEPRTGEVLVLLGGSASLFAQTIEDSDEAEAEARSALDLLESALQESLDEALLVDALIEAGRACATLGLGHKAVHYGRRLLDCDLAERDRLLAELDLAQSYRLDEQLDLAEQMIHQALRRAHAYPEILPALYLEWAQIQAEGRRNAEASQTIQSGLAILGNSPVSEGSRPIFLSSLICLAASLRGSNDCAEAQTTYRRIMADIGPGEEYFGVEAQLGVAFVHHDAGQFNEALAAYRLVLDSPKATREQKAAARRDSLRVSASQRFADNAYEEAKADYLRLLALPSLDDETRVEAVLTVAHCNSALGLHAAAEEGYREILDDAASPAWMKEEARRLRAYSAARHLYSRSQYAHARVEFERNLESGLFREGLAGSAHLYAGHCCCWLQDFPAAQSHYRAVLDSPRASDSDKEPARTWLNAIPSLSSRDSALRLVQ